MDKYEYNVLAQQIKDLIAEGEYAKAVEIADKIDWRKVRSVMMLCTISDLYKANRRYQESKDILLMAYEKHPEGRLIVYSLCELSLKLDEYVQAMEYYKEFINLAPRDTSRYILLYRLYEEQDVSLEERIAVLEEFKKKDYRERWAYELAYLYHRVGFASKCVEECDEMFLWFGEGKYVLKALELKQLHAPLDEEQQAKFDLWKHNIESGVHPAEAAEATESSVTDLAASTDEADISTAPTTEIPQAVGIEMDDIQVKTVDVGLYNTVNLQKELAESMKSILADTVAEGEEQMVPESDVDIFADGNPGFPEDAFVDEEPDASEEEVFFNADEDEEEYVPEAPIIPEEIKPYGGIKELAFVSQDTKALGGKQEGAKQGFPMITLEPPVIQVEAKVSRQEAQQVMDLMKQDTASLQAIAKAAEETVPGAKTGVLTPLNTGSSKFDPFLSQEYDGQIKLAMPDPDMIEKQITGQMCIEDVLKEWERKKKEHEGKRQEEVRRRILQHTGGLFDEFDDATKSGLLEQLEKAFVEAIMKESDTDLEMRRTLGEEIKKEAKAAVDRVHSERAEEASTKETEAEAVDETKDVEASVAEEEIDAQEKEPVESKEEGSDEVEATADDEASSEEASVEEIAEEKEEVEVSDSLEMETEENPSAIEEEEEESDHDEAIAQIEEALADHAEEIEKKAAELAKKKVTKKEHKGNARELTKEEKTLFAPFLKHKKAKEQLIFALENISMSAYTGNVIVTGAVGSGTVDLARTLVKEVQKADSNFSGQVAKIAGYKLNGKDMGSTVERLDGGALIIEKASSMEQSTVEDLIVALNDENLGIIIILEDTKKAINTMIQDIPALTDCFNVRVDIEALDDDALVEYAKEYAMEQEFVVDPLAVLALHSRIGALQTVDHDVTLAEIRELMDEAMYYAGRKTPKHFMDILVGKRYDDDDMIIIRENDFTHGE